MDMDTYRAEVRRTTADGPLMEQIVMGALGLAGEAGELANEVKKVAFHGHDINSERIRDEAGDVLWYLVFLLDCYGMTLDEVMQANVAKLRRRYPAGFDAERSRNRDGGESEASA